MYPINAYKCLDSFCEDPRVIHSRFMASPSIGLLDRNLASPITPSFDREFISQWSQCSRNLYSPSPCPYAQWLAPSTPAPRHAIQTISSPNVLSQSSPLLYPDFSPPSFRNTPFDRQFTTALPCISFNPDSEFSPIARKNPLCLYEYPVSPLGPKDSMSQSTNDSGCCEKILPSQRKSLMEKFLSVAHKRATFSVQPSDHDLLDCPMSPLSKVSTLTPLSSPESTNVRHPSEMAILSQVSSCRNISERAIETAVPSRLQSEQSLDACSSKQSSQSYEYGFGCQPARRPQDHKYKRKRIPTDTYAEATMDDCREHKKRCTMKLVEDAPTPPSPDCKKPSRRRLPSGIPYHPQFPLLYRRFPVSSYLEIHGKPIPLVPGLKFPGGTYNPTHSPLDLYTPRFVRGRGTTKVGLCPVCIESPARGGKGEKVWLSMKFSAYKHYHMQYAHGISATSSSPFSPPVEFRTTKRINPAKHERTHIVEGKCHSCQKWIQVESMKNIEVKVKELYWWKHAAACHKGTHIEGDDDFFEDDDIHRKIRELFE